MPVRVPRPPIVGLCRQLERTYWEARVYRGRRAVEDDASVPEEILIESPDWEDARHDQVPRTGYAYGVRRRLIGDHIVDYELVRKNMWGPR